MRRKGRSVSQDEEGGGQYLYEATPSPSNVLEIGEVLGDWKKTSVTLIFKKGRKDDPGTASQPTSVPGKAAKQIPAHKRKGDWKQPAWTCQSLTTSMIAACDAVTSFCGSRVWLMLFP